MSGNYLGIKKLNRVKQKYPDFDIHTACIDNGSHLVIIQMKDGTQWVEQDNKLVQMSNWIEHSSRPGIAVSVDELEKIKESLKHKS